MITEAQLGPFRQMWIKNLIFMARGDPLFTQWHSEQSEVVTPVRSRLVPDVAREIKKWMNREKPEIKQCWTNSFDCSLHIRGVDIVHGFLLTAGAGPIKHAWNCYNGVHFDVTRLSLA
jgi:hypothetical protein